MNCPKCQSKSHVLETRDTSRRRECTSCKYRFWTAEVLRSDLPEYARPYINHNREAIPVLIKLPWS